ncbi:hypothetical protein M9Y10_019811 [Tritrichomonas musculus]|uniref:Lecithin:cholesterol acyltransferase family protein n=1 Tax=Tritrichomonas musculus TaxID=1915356 RepID=A0ABR2HII3_9EUKA
MLLLFFGFTISLKPLFFATGLGLSPIYGTVTQPDLYPECPANLNKTSIRYGTSSNQNLIKNYPDCIAKLFRVQLNSSTGKVEQLPGIITDSSPIGETIHLSTTYATIVAEAQKIGYVDNENLFSVGFNYLLHPVTSYSVYDKLKEKIEEVYNKNHEKSVLISFSQGSFFSIFISNYSTKDWVKKYVDSIIFIAPAFAGYPTFSELFRQQLSPYVANEELKKSIMRMPGFHLMMPNYVVYENFTLIYNLNEDYDQHNASFAFEFLKSQGKVDDESEKIFKEIAEKYLKEPIPEPPVPSLIIYNDNVKMSVSYSIYQYQNKIVKENVFPSYGDGMVTADSARYACGHWKSAKCFNLRDSSSHVKILSNPKTIKALFDFIQNDNRVVEPKIGLFLASGFNGSPLYATVTDPTNKICPKNLKNFPFLSSFFTNVHQLVDTDASNWLSDECKAMLTRVELSDDETHVTFAPGIHIKSSPFGQYDFLLSFTKILQKAFLEGWTYDRDLFGVGYNYMLHPLMTTETYEELKNRIEKYFDETGKKSVLAGHSQGSSFVEIFITDYVTPEWARKYMAGVIFYAPAFAGWGTYDRSVSGKYGSGFPDANIEMKKSTMRMPGLHIMMPNEAVFGNKTVIKDFPNQGDESNATFVAPLLQKLGQLDDISYKIFKLTDKYRKKALPEPPVPSLIIFNNATATPNGYTYVSAKNTVSHFSGFGDGTVSGDGPVYACSHWQNVTCYNFNSTGFSHSTIQVNTVNSDLTFNFIERVHDYKPYPPDKTVLNECVKNEFSNSSYIEIYRIPDNQFTYSAHEGLSAYPLSYSFDNNPDTFYISSVNNNISYHNNVTIVFDDVVMLEAFLYDTCRLTNDGIKYATFQGFPSVLNAYSAIGNGDFELNTVFVGFPMYPSQRLQFVFKNPVKCDKIKLEFAEISSQTIVGESRNPCIAGLTFIRDSKSEVLPIKGVESEFVNLIPNSNFEIVADDGLDNYELSNLFDDDESTFWISKTSNSDLFHNFIEVDFIEVVSLESILYDSALDNSRSTQSYSGFPLILNVYSSENNEKPSFVASFAGTPENPTRRVQFNFNENLVCKKLRLEFVNVSSQSISGTGNNPVCAGLKFVGRVLPPATTPIPSPSQSSSHSPSPSSGQATEPTENIDTTIYVPISSSVDDSVDNNQSDTNSSSSKERDIMIAGYSVFGILVVILVILIIIKIRMRRQVSNMDQA